MSATDLFEARYVHPRVGRTLIVGSHIYQGKPDRRLRYADAVGVDMRGGDGVDLVLDLECPPPKDLGRFAHIECLSVLEHSRRPWDLAANLERLLIPGGTIYVQVPFVWRYHGYPADYWRFTPDGVRQLFPGIQWSVIQYAHRGLTPKNYVPSVGDREGGVYFQRTEVCGFGRRKCEISS